MITLSAIKINLNDTNFNKNSIEEYIYGYYNFCNCNDFNNFICPCCKNKGHLSFYKIYKRNLTYTNKENKIINTIVNITVLKCNYCTVKGNNQKYHALLPFFVLPYHIYEANIIISSINDYFNNKNVTDIINKNKMTHKLFYDWLHKFNKYALSSSIVLGIDINLKLLINSIFDNINSFLNIFYQNYFHPFFLFKLTCVPLCITP